jgi:ATP-dependent DNA helicase RecG
MYNLNSMPTTRITYSDDEPYDVQPLPSAHLRVLSRVLFEEEYIPNDYAPDMLAENDRSYEQRLSACRRNLP